MHDYIIIDNLISRKDTIKYVDLIDDIAEKQNKQCCPYGSGCPNSVSDDPKKFEVQDILQLPKVSDKIWNTIKQYLIDADLEYVKRESGNYKLIGLGDSVTVSRHITPIGIHKDIEGRIKFKGKVYKNVECLYKMAIYINEVSRYSSKAGGTTLYDENKQNPVTVEPKLGRALIFDMRDWHSGAKIPKGKVKYLIGFRLLYKKI